MKLCCNSLKGWCTCIFFCASGEHDNSSNGARTGLFFFGWLVGIFVRVLRG